MAEYEDFLSDFLFLSFFTDFACFFYLFRGDLCHAGARKEREKEDAIPVRGMTRNSCG